MKLYPESPSILYRAASEIAGRGNPIFPVAPGGKNPAIPKREGGQGYRDATTNQSKIAEWWEKRPEANIGIPTGKVSGLLILDFDIHKPGAMTVAEFEEKYGAISHAATVRTGGGGLQFYLAYPDGEEIRNSAGTLGPHVDVRGEGGYTIAPPSVTKGCYEWINEAPPAPVPTRLLEALKNKPEPKPGAPAMARSRAGILDEGGPIPEGTRNHTLTSIGGRLRAYGFEHEEIEDALLRINAERCTPPLPDGEVRGVAASAARYERGKGTPPPDEETLAALDAIEADLLRSPWPKISGKSERSAVVMILKLGRRVGRLLPNGRVEISVSRRALALAAATSRKTVEAILKRSAWLEKGRSGSGTNSGTIVLKTPWGERASLPHSTSRFVKRGDVASGEGSRAPSSFTAPRLRWSAPGVLRLGKSAEAVIDFLEQLGGSATVETLAECLHVARLRDFRRRVVDRLEERGIVTVSGETVALVEDWLEALNHEREVSGEIAAYRRDMERYNREREGYRNRRKTKPDHHYVNFRTDGFTSELRSAAISPLAEAIRAYLERYPEEARQRPGWIGTTLWAYDLYPHRVTPDEARAAIEELGGEAYLRKLRERVRKRAA